MEDRATVLVVDDDDSLLLLLEMILSSAGYQVITAGGGQEAWDRMRDFTPDLLLLDWMMPGYDGGMLCQQVRQSDLGRGVRVVMMSCDETLARQAIRFGADGYVLKPFDVDDLLHCVDTALRRKVYRSMSHATFAFAS